MRLVQDGVVALLVAPGFGSGWSTWMDSDVAQDAVFDPVLARLVLEGAPPEQLVAVAEERYPGEYTAGITDCVVEWVPVGTRFMIQEYDGYETLVTEHSPGWRVA